MLEQLNDEVRMCHERAAEARARAQRTSDPAIKADCLEMETRWLSLAHSCAFSETLGRFTEAQANRRPKLDQNGGDRAKPGTARVESAEAFWLASIVSSSDDAIVSKNLDGIIMSWNAGAEQLFGYTAAEAVGRPITIVIPEDRRSEEPAILDRIRRGERIDHFETVRRRKSGELIDISLTVSPVKNAQGQVIGASKIARDITERKRSDERIAALALEAEHRAKNILATVQQSISRGPKPSTTSRKLLKRGFGRSQMCMRYL
jgi:PAS domain S-box-containing protein